MERRKMAKINLQSQISVREIAALVRVFEKRNVLRNRRFSEVVRAVLVDVFLQPLLRLGHTYLDNTEQEAIDYLKNLGFVLPSKLIGKIDASPLMAISDVSTGVAVLEAQNILDTPEMRAEAERFMEVIEKGGSKQPG